MGLRFFLFLEKPENLSFWYSIINWKMIERERGLNWVSGILWFETCEDAQAFQELVPTFTDSLSYVRPY